MFQDVTKFTSEIKIRDKLNQKKNGGAERSACLSFPLLNQTDDLSSHLLCKHILSVFFCKIQQNFSSLS